MHKPVAQLKDELKQSSAQVKLGGIYTHYKDNSKTYKIVDFVIIEADDSVGVVYQAQYADNIKFVRPLKSFVQKVGFNGKPADRFTRVN